jgi:hypothetical protein
MTDEPKKGIRDLIDDAEEITSATAALESQQSEQGNDAERRGQTQTDVLIKLAAEAIPFHAPNGTGYVDVKIKGHRETWTIESPTCRNWLRRRYYKVAGRVPSHDAVQRALEWLEAQAEFEGPERKVHVRVAREDGRIYLDLGDEHWRAVEITTEGWSIIADPPVRFRRPAGMLSLPIPSERGSLDSLKQFLNASESHFVLAVGWLLAALRGQGPYWVLALSGEQGSAKSTFSRMIRAILDPHNAPLRTLPRTEHDFYIAATSGHVLAFDNVSDLKPWQSDVLCRLSTGGSYGSRRLYTDQEEVLISAECPVITNGIEEVVTGQDLAERALQIALESISEDSRLPEDELWPRFNEQLPGILGALLNAIVHGLKNYSNVAPRRLPRMADHYKFVVACQPALWPAGTFEQAFWQNRDEAVQVGIEADPVASAIVEWASQQVQATQTMQTMQTMPSRLPPPTELQIFAGTATDLNQQLRGYADEFVRKSMHWPQLPQALSGRLKRAAPALRRFGITIKNDLLGRKRTTMIYITVEIEQFMARSSSSCEEEVHMEDEVDMEPGDQQTTSGALPKSSSAPSASSADTMKETTPPEQPKSQEVLVPKPPNPVPNQIMTPAAPSAVAAPVGQTAAFAGPTVRKHTVRKPVVPQDPT